MDLPIKNAEIKNDSDIPTSKSDSQEFEGLVLSVSVCPIIRTLKEQIITSSEKIIYHFLVILARDPVILGFRFR